MADTRMRGWTANSPAGPLSATCSLAKLRFRRQDVPAVRRLATEFGACAGMGTTRLADFVLAVSEAASCAVSHGPCTAGLQLWLSGARVFCDIHGDGMLLGHGPRAVEQGDADVLRRRLLRQICDYARVESGPSGVTVRFSMSVA